VIHKTGYLLNDIKPDNIRYRPGGRAVFTDMGASAKFTHGMTYNFVATTDWSTPDQNMKLDGSKNEVVRLSAPDVWQLGKTLVDIVYAPCYLFDVPGTKHVTTDKHAYLLGLPAMVTDEWTINGVDFRSTKAFQAKNQKMQSDKEAELFPWDDILRTNETLNDGSTFKERVERSLAWDKGVRCPAGMCVGGETDAEGEGEGEEYDDGYGGHGYGYSGDVWGAFALPRKEEIDEVVMALAREMLRFDPADRTSPTKALQHPFFAMNFSSST